MSTPETLQVRVRAVTYEAEGILGFELVPMPPLKELPPFTAGSHIDLHLPNGLLDNGGPQELCDNVFHGYLARLPE